VAPQKGRQQGALQVTVPQIAAAVAGREPHAPYQGILLLLLLLLLLLSVPHIADATAGREPRAPHQGTRNSQK